MFSIFQSASPVYQEIERQSKSKHVKVRDTIHLDCLTWRHVALVFDTFDWVHAVMAVDFTKVRDESKAFEKCPHSPWVIASVFISMQTVLHCTHSQSSTLQSAYRVQFHSDIDVQSNTLIVHQDSNLRRFRPTICRMLNKQSCPYWLSREANL